jgi:hypothetical protein
LKIRKIQSWKRFWSSDAEKHAVEITLHVSQEELDALKEKGLVSLLGGKADGN